MKKLILVIFFLLSYSVTFSKRLTVILEPLPPMVIDTNNGYTIEILKSIEKISNLKFDIIIAPYNRAKYMLKVKKADLIGHTLYKFESNEFYKYAVEINFHIDTHIGIFSSKKENLKHFSNFKIGTPYGNKELLSKLLNIPQKNFREDSVDKLLVRLSANRINIFVFEFTATMENIKKLKIKNIYYKKLNTSSLKLGLAIQNNNEGLELKKEMEDLIKKINIDKIIKEHIDYLKMPKEGIIKID